jgi:hypothetical protein
MIEPHKVESEGELLQDLLEELSPKQAFMFGKVMGIMGKGDRLHISKLENHIDSLEQIIEEQKKALENKEA